MANYNDAQKQLQQLKAIINQCIENHPSVKSAIKAQKAVVANVDNPVDTTAKTVKVKFLPDIFNEEVESLTFPYNPQMESYLTTGIIKGKTVSVWYYQSLSNGIVMQDGSWGESIEDGGTINGELVLKAPVLSKNGDNPTYVLPFVPFGEIDPTHDTQTYFKELLKWICRNYPNVSGGTWFGRVRPNSAGTAIIDIYDTSKTNNEGLPEYSTGTYRALTNTIVVFSTSSYGFTIRDI